MTDGYIEEIFVMKQKSGWKAPRYRYRIQGEDFSIDYMNSLDGFKFKYSSNMTKEDIEKVEKRWELKLIKEDYVN